MGTYLNSNDKKECCGCRACEQICPKKCIEMVKVEGFLYPQIDKNECINCKLCEKVCQVSQKEKLKHTGKKRTFAAWNAKEKELASSTSGGMFPALSDSIIEDGGIVYGAVLDIGSKEIFIKRAETLNAREAMRKSKYVWSDTTSVYSDIKKELDKGERILFSGTPCQIAGLRSFLRKDYEKLFCVDIICHGMPSNTVFQSYVEYLEEKYQSNLKSFEFRYKKEGVMKSCYRIEFENGIALEEGLGENAYSLTYNSLIAHMPMCNQCPYASKDRVSDITIGDFWGIENIDSENMNHRGTSLVIVNTKKGEELWGKSLKNICFHEENINEAMKYNPALCAPTKRHPWQRAFLKCIEKNGFKKAFTIYVKIGNKPMIIYRIFRKIKEIINRKLGN